MDETSVSQGAPVAEQPIRLGDVLRQAQEGGKAKREGFFKSARERISGFKESALAKWGAFTESVGKVGETIVGVATIPEVQKGVAAFAGQELRKAQEATKQKGVEARARFQEGVGKMVNAAREKFDDAKQGYTEHVQPVIDKSVDAGKRAGKLALNVAALPVVGAVAAYKLGEQGATWAGKKVGEGAVKFGEAAVSGVQYVGDKAIEGLDWVDEQKRLAGEKAQELGDRAVNYANGRVEATKHGLDVAKVSVSAKLDELAVNASAADARAAEMTGKVLQAPERALSWLSSKFQEVRAGFEKSKEATNAKLAKRQERLALTRAVGAELRGGARSVAEAKAKVAANTTSDATRPAIT